MATGRLDMRLDSKIKEKFERAAALANKTLTDYVLGLVEDAADKIIAQHETITVSEDSFTRFWDACENAPEPNEALKKATRRAREQGFIK